MGRVRGKSHYSARQHIAHSTDHRLSQTLFRAFLSYERTLLGLEGDFTRFQEMRNILNVDIEQSSSSLETTVVLSSHKRGFQEGFNHGQRLRLCSLLSLYRLLDVFAWLSNFGRNTVMMMTPKPKLEVEGLKVRVFSPFCDSFQCLIASGRAIENFTTGHSYC